MDEIKTAKLRVDNLCDFPDEICSHILSFLPTAEAVKTSTLSSRWRHIYKDVPHIESSIESIKCAMIQLSEIIAKVQVIMTEMLLDVSEIREINALFAISDETDKIKRLLGKTASVCVSMIESKVNVKRLEEELNATMKLGEAQTCSIQLRAYTMGVDDDDDGDDEDGDGDGDEAE